MGIRPLRTPEMLAFDLVVDVPRPGYYPDFVLLGYRPLRGKVAVAIFGSRHVPVGYYSSV